LRADYWRKGYALEAATACLDLAFNRFDAKMVYAMTSERNVASWRMMEKLGMQHCADLNFPDPDYPPKDNPTMVYSIEKKQ
jgi:RimJ/RimL family protein N-acetyltransferase